VRNKLGLLMMALGLSLSSCSSPESQVISKFFMATRSQDNATLTGLTLVGFPEEATAWKVTEVGPERREPFALPELIKSVEEAKTARDLQYGEFATFRQGHIEDLKRIEERLQKDPAATFRGAQAEVHAAWEKYRADRRDLEGRLNEVERLMEQEQRLTLMSLLGPVEASRLRSYTGDLVTKEVVVRVTLKSGEQKPYRFTMQRYLLNEPESGRTAAARWIITDIRPQGADEVTSSGSS
jgi:hypothetical protein